MSWFLAIAGYVLSLLTGTKSESYYEGWADGARTLGALWFISHLVDKMKMNFRDLMILLGLGVIVYYVVTGPRLNVDVTPHLPPSVPSPNDNTFPWPWRKGDFMESDGVGPGGIEVITDLPPALRKANIASKGLGCCVFRSADHAARLQGIEPIYGMPEWMVSKGIEGGGYPKKVDELFEKICKDRNVPTIAYVQHEGGDMEVLDRWIATGRMICVTYAGQDNRYKSGIDHMVNLVYLDKTSAAILDNNFVEQKQGPYLWMSRKEFETRWKGRGGGWAFLFLDSPAPQPPRN